MTEVLKSELTNGLLTLIMNRPERRNALDPNLTLALRDATAAAMEDPEVRAVLLTGAGGHFCVGGDVKAMNEGSGRDAPLGQRIHNLKDRMNAARYPWPSPVISGSALKTQKSRLLSRRWAFPEILEELILSHKYWGRQRHGNSTCFRLFSVVHRQRILVW